MDTISITFVDLRTGYFNLQHLSMNAVASNSCRSYYDNLAKNLPRFLFSRHCLQDQPPLTKR